MEIPSNNHNDHKMEVNDDYGICEVPNNFNVECEVLSDDSDYEEEPVDRLLSIPELMKIRQDAIESYRNCEDTSPSEKELTLRIMGWN